MCKAFVFSCLVLLFALAGAPLNAQSLGAGVISGVVTDESHAALPGVTVTATSPALQAAALTTATGPDGAYRFPTLPPGVYQLTFELAGFQRVARQELRLDVGFIATINIEMKIGGVEESLTIVGESPVVDVKTTSVQTNFTNEMLETVPVARQSVQRLRDHSGSPRQRRARRRRQHARRCAGLRGIRRQSGSIRR